MKKLGTTAQALSALGHEARLSIFRLLVKAGEDGLNIGDLGAHLGIPATTLGHHLTTLVNARLVVQERLGREVINRVDYNAMRSVVGFLTSECCTGVTVVEKKAA